MLALPATAGQVNWAHQAGAMQSNGAVVVKSLSGASYAGTSNPAGAVAKANQNASTQPPTVIIQATSTSYSETLPLVVDGLVPPSCPTTFTAVFSRTGTGAFKATDAAYNVSGTRWSLIGLSVNGTLYAAWVADNPAMSGSSASPQPVNGGMIQTYFSAYNSTSRSYNWAVTLCSK